MKKLIPTLLFVLFASAYGHAQFFRATITASGNDLVFLIKPNPGGGNITCGWSDIEFFVRYSNTASGFSFGAITINSIAFPGIAIPNNGVNVQGAEPGYNNIWFGSSFAGTSVKTYLDGTVYEVFRVSVSIAPTQISGMELVANEPNYSPHYLVLTDQNGGEKTARYDGSILFYGANATICNPNCPVSTAGANHVDPLGAPLPLELTRFAARALNATDALLYWESTNETNSSHFEIERSADGQAWMYIGKKPAAGQSHAALNYDFVDEKVYALDGPNSMYYYRLKMVDLDGSFAYSQIVSVSFESARSIRVFPNPFTNIFQVEIVSSKEGSLSAKIFDSTGRMVWQGELQHGVQALEQAYLQSGIYWLEVDFGDRLEHLRIVKN